MGGKFIQLLAALRRLGPSHNNQQSRSPSFVAFHELPHELPLSHITHVPVFAAELPNIEYHLSHLLHLFIRIPNTRLNDLFEAYIRLKFSHDGLVPPHHHVVDIALN